jgi:outer membrane biogenesis lipoprotein LolB
MTTHTIDRATRDTARLEDIAFMADAGESLIGAAHRLGLSVNGLETWLRNRDRNDLAIRLRARDPLPNPTYSAKGKVK